MLTKKMRLLSLILCLGLFPISALAKVREPRKKVTVPEPSSIAFAGIGVVGLAGAIRRKFRSAH
jgi:hypothetical protein